MQISVRECSLVPDIAVILFCSPSAEAHVNGQYHFAIITHSCVVGLLTRHSRFYSFVRTLLSSFYSLTYIIFFEITVETGSNGVCVDGQRYLTFRTQSHTGLYLYYPPPSSLLPSSFFFITLLLLLYYPPSSSLLPSSFFFIILLLLLYYPPSVDLISLLLCVHCSDLR